MNITPEEQRKMDFFYKLCRSCQRMVATKIVRKEKIKSEDMCNDCRILCEDRMKRLGGEVNGQ